MIIKKMSQLAAAPQLNILAMALLGLFLVIFTVAASNVFRVHIAEWHTWPFVWSVIKMEQVIHLVS